MLLLSFGKAQSSRPRRLLLKDTVYLIVLLVLPGVFGTSLYPSPNLIQIEDGHRINFQNAIKGQEIVGRDTREMSKTDEASPVQTFKQNFGGVLEVCFTK